MLGDAQWHWLEETLKQPAELRLLVSSIQFAAEVHGGECWENLPHEKQRLLGVLRRTKASGVIILSGDRHWCEFSRLEGPCGYPLHDFTSSAMTQKHPRGTPTPNKNRFLPQTYHLPSVGHIDVAWGGGDAQITVKVIDVEGGTQIAHTLKLSELQAV
jgi:alkaline phosphatase D